MDPLLIEYGRLKELKSDRDLGLVQAPRPLRMLGPRYMPFRMRHEPYDVPIRAADAGNSVHRAVRISPLITENDLSFFLESGQRLGVLGHKFAFAVGDGKVPLEIGCRKPRASRFFTPHAYPVALETAGIVRGQCNGLDEFGVPASAFAPAGRPRQVPG